MWFTQNEILSSISVTLTLSYSLIHSLPRLCWWMFVLVYDYFPSLSLFLSSLSSPTKLNYQPEAPFAAECHLICYQQINISRSLLNSKIEGEKIFSFSFSWQISILLDEKILKLKLDSFFFVAFFLFFLFFDVTVSYCWQFFTKADYV